MPSIKLLEDFTIEVSKKESNINVLFQEHDSGFDRLSFEKTISLCDYQFQLRDEQNSKKSFIFFLSLIKVDTLIANISIKVKNYERSLELSILLKDEQLEILNWHDLVIKISEFTSELFPAHNQEIFFHNNGNKQAKISAGRVILSRCADKCDCYYYCVPVNLNLVDIEEVLLNSLIIARDAGGSVHLASMLAELKIVPYAILEGLALDIFHSQNVKTLHFDLKNIDKIKYVLCGTSLYGGADSLVFEDKIFGEITKIAILDSWVNYKNRFHESGDFYPDFFWVTDEIAKSIAQAEFRHSNVIQIPNYFLARLTREYIEIDLDSNCLLMVLEPISNTNYANTFPIGDWNERFEAVKNLAHKHNIREVVIRLHPTQNVEDASALFDFTDPQLNFIISRNELTYDLARAKIVVGFSSYVLYISSKLNKITCSFFSGDLKHWTRNFANIFTLSSI